MIKFFNKHFWVLLLLIVLISYGQTLFMFPWQDDHTVFFKLMNVSEKAGYFGYGPFGQGVYKYIVTPYIPIQKFFGFNPVAFFSLAITFYYLATLTVYKVFSEVISPRGGRIAGLLYACGYVASDGYIRIFNSVSTSFGIILVSLLFLFYYRFIKDRGIRWYTLSVLFYFLALEFATVRTHYLIAAVIAFELVFKSLKKPLGSIISSLIRLIPFGFIFYKYFLENADSRSSQIGTFLRDLLAGNFSKLYSFFSAITNIIFPDWLLKSVSGLMGLNSLMTFTVVLILFGLSRLFVKNRLKTKVLTVYLIALPLWGLVVNRVFVTSSLGLSSQSLYEVFFGGVILLLLPTLLISLERKWRALTLFLIIWGLFNISSYAVYNPALGFTQYHRYLAHSFLPLVGIFGILYVNTKSRLIILWGLMSLVSAATYQNKILETRSYPVKRFYSQLKEFVPVAKKGDIFYFDVADNARGYFSDAFSVASMPEETAIAWQYGLDRYDIRRLTEYPELAKLISEGSFTDINKVPTKIGNIYSFFYSKDGLVDTSEELHLLDESPGVLNEVDFTSEINGNEVVINLVSPIPSINSNKITLELTSSSPRLEDIEFPYITDQKLSANSIAKNSDLRLKAFEYKRSKELVRTATNVTATSSWKAEVPSNLTDGRMDTHWRADRVIWSKEGASLTLDLGRVLNISRFVWLNGNATNTPTKYSIEVSLDKSTWKKVAEVDTNLRVDGGVHQVVAFNPQSVRYLRMVLTATLSRDSASIAEAWVVPTSFDTLDIKEVEEFLVSPLGFVPDALGLLTTLNAMDYMGRVQVAWFGNKSDSWSTTEVSTIKVNYDGIPRRYEIAIPAGGTEIRKLKLTQKQIFGDLHVNQILDDK